MPLQREGMIDELKEIYGLAEEEPEGYELRIMEGLYRLWMGLYKSAEPFLDMAQAVEDTHADRVKTMLAFVHKNYGEALSVADIAASANISEREAFRSFKQVLGTTPTLYLLNHRINNATRMLVETNMSITEISMACGFSRSSYMWRAFRDINGVSPRTFRQGSRQGE